MKRAEATLCAAILATLAGVHVYWARGGEAFSASVVPTKRGRNGDVPVALFDPGPVATIGVAAGLTVAALTVLRAGFTGKSRGFARLVALLFFARAVGEFHYVGYTKRVRGTAFSRRDDWIYAPLCIVVAKLAAGATK